MVRTTEEGKGRGGGGGQDRHGSAAHLGLELSASPWRVPLGGRRSDLDPIDRVGSPPPSGTLHGAPERGRGEGEGFMTLVDETTVVESRFNFTSDK